MCRTYTTEELTTPPGMTITTGEDLASSMLMETPVMTTKKSMTKGKSQFSIKPLKTSSSS